MKNAQSSNEMEAERFLQENSIFSPEIKDVYWLIRDRKLADDRRKLARSTGLLGTIDEMKPASQNCFDLPTTFIMIAIELVSQQFPSWTCALARLMRCSWT